MSRPRTKPNTPRTEANRSRDILRYYEADPFDGWAKTALDNAKRRARLKGKRCTLTVDDIKQAAQGVTHCPITGVELFYGRGYGLRSNSASIDRLDNDSDYVKGSIAIISMRANAIKSNFSVSEMVALGNYAAKLTP